MNYNKMLVSVVTDSLETRGRVTIADLRDAFLSQYPDAMEGWGKQLLQQALHVRIKAIMSRHADIDGIDTGKSAEQLGLPGMAPPAALAIELDDGCVEYVAYSNATWDDLEAAYETRTQNVERAQAKQRDHHDKMAFLRPVMQGTRLLLKEALGLIKKKP